MITRSKAIAALEEAVAEKGEDYVYRTDNPGGQCYYSVDGEPSCIVGHVFAKLDQELFRDVADWEARYHQSMSVRTVRTRWPSRMDYDALEALSMAQVYQDAGRTWGQAVKAATSVVETV
jgi:hypothetical protein